MTPTHLFVDVASVSREQRVSNGAGGWTTVLTPVGMVRGRMRSWTTEEQLIARQAGVRVGWVFYTGPDADVRRGDVLRVRDVEATVRAVREPSQPGHHKMVDLDERQA